MSETKKTSRGVLRFKYIAYVLVASVFGLIGISNFRIIVSSPGFDQKVLAATLFMILDIILFYYYNSRALHFLKELREFDQPKSE